MRVRFGSGQGQHPVPVKVSSNIISLEASSINKDRHSNKRFNFLFGDICCIHSNSM